MAIVLGLDAKLFRGEAGTQAAIEVTNVKDVSLTLESGEADVTTRAAQGWKLSAATLKEASLEINILYDTEDEDFLAFKTAYFTNSPMSLFIRQKKRAQVGANHVFLKSSKEHAEHGGCRPCRSRRSRAWPSGTAKTIRAGRCPKTSALQKTAFRPRESELISPPGAAFFRTRLRQVGEPALFFRTRARPCQVTRRIVSARLRARPLSAASRCGRPCPHSGTFLCLPRRRWRRMRGSSVCFRPEVFG